MKILQYIFQIALIFVAAILIAGIAISLYPFKEYVFKTQPYDVLTPRVKPGESLKFVTDYCKLSDASGEITQIWEGPSRKIINLGIFQANEGCVASTLIVTVPVDLAPGMYTLHGHGNYSKLLVGKAKVDTYTKFFEVTAN